jgi:hypothetical protein
MARRVLLWGHDRVVEATITSFRGHPQDLTARIG